MKIKLFTNSGNFERNIVLEGFDMTGHLTLSRNPMTAHEAATKRYVDNFPYNLSVENIVGGPVLVERLAQGIDGDITMYNDSQTVLKAVVASGSYSQVTVNSKGQIVAGVAPSNDNAVPTLQFTEVKQKPTTLSGYVTDASGYIRNTSDAVNQPLTGSLTLSRTPTTDTEAANYGYLTNKIATMDKGAPIGELAIKPNTSTHPTYLRANGAILDKATYAALCAVIGDTFNNDGGVGYMGQPWRQQYAFNTQQSTDITGWTTGTSLPTTVAYSQAIVTKNRLYLLGGVDSSAVYTAPINADGTLGPWTTGTSLPATVYYSQAIVTSNRVYLLGGIVNGVHSSTVYTAPINADGTLGPWTTGPSLPAAVYYSQAVVTKNRVYLLGGYVNGSTSATAAVYTAPINADGTLGTWTTGTSLPDTVYGSQAIVTQNRVYLLGGIVNSSPSATVYTAPINADGTLGAWTTGTSLPATVDRSQAIVTSNRVYLLGGIVNGSSSSTVYTAPINADGTLGPWTTGTSLPATVDRSQAIVTSNRVYLLGGIVNGSSSSTVYTAPFSGGTNDYLTLIANNTVDSTTQFKLPDLSANNDGIYEYYIKALP